MTFLVVIPAVASLLPGVELTPQLAFIPILNTSLVCKEIMTGTYHWNAIALIFVSTCAYAGSHCSWLSRRFSASRCCSALDTPNFAVNFAYLENAATNSHLADHSVISADARSGRRLAGRTLVSAPHQTRAITQLVREADITFEQVGVHRDSFDVRASEGVLLRGWKVTAAKPNGNWVWCTTE